MSDVPARLAAAVLLLAVLATTPPASAQVTVPDLEPVALDTDPTDPRVDEEVHAIATVRNNDQEDDAQDVQVAFEVDGDELSQHTVDVPAGETIEVRSGAWTPGAGGHELRVEVYAGQDVDEGQLTDSPADHNNERAIDVVVGPDLTVTAAALSPSSPIEDDPVRVKVTVENTDANEDVDAPFDLHVEILDAGDNQVFSRLVRLDGLRYGETLQREVGNWSAGTGSHTLRVVADAGDEVAEGSEANNTLTRSFEVEEARPDAALAGVTALDRTPDPGDPVRFRATVENRGTGPIDRDVDVRFLVNGSVHGPDVVLNASEDPIEPGEQRTATSQAWTARGGRHNVTAIVDPGNGDLPDESDETNNRAYLDLTIGPDLVVDDLAWTPDRPAAGEEVRFNVTVRNRGSSPVPGDARLTLAVEDTGFTGSAEIPRLDADVAATLSLGPWTPDSADRYRVVATADADDAVAEAGEDNNQRTEQLEASQPRPDLVVTRIQPDPAKPEPGNDVTFTARVANRGSSQADAFDVRFAIDGDQLGANKTIGGPLAPLEPGEAAEVTSDAWDATLGNHTITVTADANDDVQEIREANNQRRIPLPVGADLAPLEIGIRPQDPEPGETVLFNVTLANQGTSPAARHVVTLELGGENLGDATVGELEGGQQTTVKGWSWTAVQGDVAVRATVDTRDDVPEFDETDNRREESYSVGSAADLEVTELSWSPSPRHGDRVLLSATLRNAGPSDVQGSISVRFTIDGKPVGTATLDQLAAKKSATVTSGPWIATSGEHRIEAQADPDDRVQEADETNNAASRTLAVLPTGPGGPQGTGPPDLVPVNVSLPATLAPGDQVAFLAAVENRGQTLARDVTVRFLLDGTRELGELPIDELAPGQSATVASDRWEATPGHHSIELLVDDADEIVEADETNNQRIRTFIVGAGPGAGGTGLDVTAIGLDPSEPEHGDEVRINVTVTNTGQAASGPFSVRLLVDGDALSGESRNLAGLTPGRAHQAAFTWTAQAGNHTLTAVVDPGEAPDQDASDDVERSTTVVVEQAEGVPAPGWAALASAVGAALVARSRPRCSG